MSNAIEIDALELEIPDTMRPMSELETAQYYPGQNVTIAWIDDDANAVFRLEKTGRTIPEGGVEGVLLNQLALYRRLAPGFEMGEILVGSEEANKGVITFKSNAINRDLFNIFGVIDVNGAEYDILVSCDMDDAITMAPLWSKVISDIKIKVREQDNE